MMSRYLSLVLVVLVWRISNSNSLKLFQYGSIVGDAKLPKRDDSSSSAIQLEPGILLSGKQYSSLYVSTKIV